MARLPYCLIAATAVVVLAGGCKRDNDRFATATGTSAFLDDASPEAREALSLQVDYRLTDENFARWEVAQRNLDRLPRNAIPADGRSGGGNVIDRAVARLQSSPRARKAIESAGLSVRDFVLQTVALAQATEAAQGGRTAGAGLVPPENFRFVDRHRERIRRAQLAARTARRARETSDIEIDSVTETAADTAIASEANVLGSQPQESRERGSTGDTAVTEEVRESAPPPPRDTATGDSVTVGVDVRS